MKTIVYIISISLLLTSCGKKDTPPEVETTTNTTPVKQKITVPVSENIECFGTIDVPPFAIHEEFAKTDGYIKDLSILEGQEVKKGEVIAKMESPEFAKLQNALQTAKATYDWQNAQYKRNVQLHEQKAISDKAFELIEKDYLVAKSTYEGLIEEVKAIGFDVNAFMAGKQTTLLIKSKTTGSVVQIHIKNGSKVSSDKHLFTILDQSHLHVEMSVSGTDIAKVQLKQPFFLVQAEDTIRGTVHLINTMLEDDNTVKVHGHFDDPADEKKLIVGQKVFVNIVP